MKVCDLCQNQTNVVFPVNKRDIEIAFSAIIDVDNDFVNLCESCKSIYNNLRNM